MNREDISKKLKAFLCKFFGKKNVETLGEDDDFFGLGFVNSLFAMQLITFIETEFDVTIDVVQLDMDNFNTLKKIINIIEEKMK